MVREEMEEKGRKERSGARGLTLEVTDGHG